jgi:predicted nucleic acid-binding Zn ribbon protein
MTCPICSSEHERKGTYCSKKCTDKAYRERKKGSVNAPLLIKRDSVKFPIVNIPKESGPKLKWCNFCGASIEQSHKLGFCNNEHEKNYWTLVHNSGTLKLKIDSRTVIETKKYTKVQEIIDTIMNRNSHSHSVTLF